MSARPSADGRTRAAHSDRAKLVLVGDGQAGKTCLLTVHATGKFPKVYVPAVFGNHTYTHTAADGRPVVLDILDQMHVMEDYCAQLHLRPLREGHYSYPDTSVCLVCFSVMDRDSFEKIPERWVTLLRHYCPKVPRLLVGTKCDLRSDEATLAQLKKKGEAPITFEQGAELAKLVGAVAYRECSALSQEGVTDVFDTAVQAGHPTGASIKQMQARLMPRIKQKRQCALM